jgi:putative membrane protein
MFQISSLLKSSVLAGAICFAAASAVAQSTGKPPDPQIGDIGYTAGQADIGTAILALKKTENKAVESFAEDMIRDHLAVNKKLMALLHKLQITPEASDTSKTMYRNASIKQEELWKLSGAAFDKAYAQNEVAFHEAVNGALESTLILSAQDGELKSLLETDLKLFKEHQKHAEHLVSELKSS